MHVFYMALLLAPCAPTGDWSAEIPMRSMSASAYFVETGAPVALSIQSDRAGAASAWPRNDIQWLFERSNGFQRNHDTLPPAIGQSDRTEVTPGIPGVTMIGLDFKPRPFALTPGEFAELLRRVPTHSTDASRAANTAAVAGPAIAVRHEASASMLIRVGEETEPSAIATSKAGLRCEIRAFLDPTSMPVGGDLPIRVYADGDKAAGARVRIVSPQGAILETAANPSGTATIAISTGGVWQIEAWYLTPAQTGDDLGWVLYSTSITFEVPDIASKAGAGR